MGSWSALCTTFFSKRILNVLERRTTSILNHDGAALNVYYLLPSLDVNRQSPYYKQCNRIADHLIQSVNSERSIVYPLARKEFLAQLWQTSARLLVLFEDSNTEQKDPDEFKQELSLVTDFIADGGRVLLLLLCPTNTHTESVSLDPTALGNLVSTGNEKLLPRVLASPSETLWQWTIRSAHLSNNPPDYMLVGSSSKHQATANLVSLLVDCVDRNPNLLREAVNLLGVPCGPILNGEHSASVPPVSSDRIVLYSSVGTAEQHAILDTLQTKLNHADTGVQYQMCDLGTTNRPPPAGFAWTDYWSTLRTRVLGRLLIWTESLPSSYALAERLLPSLPIDSGLLLVSNIQTQGKGRGSNHWISPVGQAAFTFHITLRKPTNSLSSKPPFPFMNFVTCMQHLVALAILLAGKRLLAGRLGFVRDGDPEPNPDWLVDLKLPGPQLRVKWPNDVYVVQHKDGESFADSDSPNYSIVGKLAGLLTKCSLSGSDRVDCIAGCGINVRNTLPSICLQQLLDRMQPSNTPFTVAEVIATLLNQMEHLIDPILDPQSTRGLDWLMDLYTRSWMHTNQRVLVRTHQDQSDGALHPCVIVGLDAFGYLRVRDVTHGAEYTLHPDGNSMDMMRGLICPK